MTSAQLCACLQASVSLAAEIAGSMDVLGLADTMLWHGKQPNHVMPASSSMCECGAAYDVL
jgi:hypothetical protein